MPRSYPADTADAAVRLFLDWFGRRYARSASTVSYTSGEGLARAAVSVGRRWEMAVTIADTLQPDATLEFDAARAAVEQRLDTAGRPVALWVPRGAPLPPAEPGLSQVLLALEEARSLDDGRLELRRPVSLYLRRTSTAGSVVTVLGGLSAHWAVFTNRVPGSFQLDSRELSRLPASPEDRDALVESIVSAANDPAAEGVQVIRAEDAWSANELPGGRACVLGTPLPESDEQSAALRRNLRRLLREAGPAIAGDAAANVLVVLGAATYAGEEKLSWAIRGMDPLLYSGYGMVAIVADGVVRALLEPPRNTLPWDAPPG